MSRFNEIDAERERLGISQKDLCACGRRDAASLFEMAAEPGIDNRTTIGKLSAALVKMRPSEGALLRQKSRTKSASSSSSAAASQLTNAST